MHCYIFDNRQWLLYHLVGSHALRRHIACTLLMWYLWEILMSWSCCLQLLKTILRDKKYIYWLIDPYNFINNHAKWTWLTANSNNLKIAKKLVGCYTGLSLQKLMKCLTAPHRDLNSCKCKKGNNQLNERNKHILKSQDNKLLNMTTKSSYSCPRACKKVH